MTRIVRHCKNHELGVALGPHAEAIYEGPTVMINGVMVRDAPPVELQRETVCWWIAARRCWAPPAAVYSVELETMMSESMGHLVDVIDGVPRFGHQARRVENRLHDFLRTATGRILRDIIQKLRADKGLRVGSDDNIATWYAVNRVLGIEGT